MVNPRAQWVALMEARRPIYERVATVRVDTDGPHRRARSPTEVELALGAGRRGRDPMTAPTRIAVGAGPAAYDVVVGPGLLDARCPTSLGDASAGCWSCIPAALTPRWPAACETCCSATASSVRRRGARRRGGQDRRGRRCAVGRCSAGRLHPHRRRGRRSAAARRPTWPASSPRPGCAASPSSTCRRRCSAWSTPRSAARPASTRPRARTWSARSIRRAGVLCDLDVAASRCPRQDFVAGLAEVVKAGSSPTRGSSSWSRPTRPRPSTRDGAVRRASWSSAASRVKADVGHRRPARGRPARGPQLRPHLRARDRAGRGLPLAARRGGQRRPGLRRRAGPAAPGGSPTTWSTGTARCCPARAADDLPRRPLGPARGRDAAGQEDARGDRCGSSCWTAWPSRAGWRARTRPCCRRPTPPSPPEPHPTSGQKSRILAGSPTWGFRPTCAASRSGLWMAADRPVRSARLLRVRGSRWPRCCVGSTAPPPRTSGGPVRPSIAAPRGRRGGRAAGSEGALRAPVVSGSLGECTATRWGGVLHERGPALGDGRRESRRHADHGAAESTRPCCAWGDPALGRPVDSRDRQSGTGDSASPDRPGLCPLPSL